MKLNPVTPTSPMAMPTGTRSSMRMNKATKPRTAMTSVLIAACSLDRLLVVGFAHQLGMEDQPVGAHGDQDHRRNVAEPGHGKKRPDRQVEIVGQHVVAGRRRDLVE